ncbi:glycosyl hydrolase [Xylariales sp. PMI_506]|nr:glycosyl hydrolase [Xylariales sp. PMI_506]
MASGDSSLDVQSYRNPIIPGFNPDPSIIRVGDDYYLVTSTFEFWPGIPIYHSKDLLRWELIGHVLTRPSQLNMRTVESSGGIWAPTLRYHKGRFYVTTVCTHRFRPKEWDIVISRGFYVYTDDIRTPDSWSDPVYYDNPGIDQDLFFDDDGKVYLSAATLVKDPRTAKHGLGIATFTCEIDLASGRSLSKPVWNRISDVGIGIAEGPHIFKKDGLWYMSTAEGGTDEGHQQWIFRSATGPLGPWEEGPRGTVNPMLFNGDHPEVRNTGHMDMVEDKDGLWWAVFLGVRPQGEDGKHRSPLGRETFMAPVEWVDGWPIVYQRRPITQSMHCARALPPQPPRDQFWEDQFEPLPDQVDPALALGWYRVRTPLKRDYSLSLRPGYLALYGGGHRIQDAECPSMVLQKQTELSMDWQTQLEFTPTEPLHEAGTVIWWSQHAYASIGLRKADVSGYEIVYKGFSMETGNFVVSIITSLLVFISGGKLTRRRRNHIP